MVHIGNQTSCWAATPLDPFEFALASGFDAFEWFPDKKPGLGWDEADLSEELRAAIRDAARARGVRLSVHARWQANPLDPEASAVLWRDLELAEDLGAELLNLHLCHEAGIEAYIEAIRPLARRVAERGLLLAIENTPHHAPEQFNELFARLRDAQGFPAGSVGMCLDVGHANLCAATRNDYLGFLDRLAPETPILHLHLHENWGDADTHLPLFTGPAGRDEAGVRGLLERLQRRQVGGSIIFEQWPSPPELLVNARARVLELIAQCAPELRAAPSRTRKNRPTAEKKAPDVAEARAIGADLNNRGLVPAKEGRGEFSPDSPPEAAESFLSDLVKADQRCRSWREKLEFVGGLFADEARVWRMQDLVDAAVYLRFLSTGAIRCVEDGRHFRPGRHAALAGQIQQRLAGLAASDTAFVIRRIHPWLPSSAPVFRRAEPLTRIRDIAHRNDIPQDLKREIKHTLQNKLHRCAGPEDLSTSAALLERIAAPGAGYPPAFVQEFRLFHEELREFFNARSLEERLNALLPGASERDAEPIRSFLCARSGAGLAGRLAALHCLVRLRRSFLERIKQASGPPSEALLLADVALEDHAFVLLSEIIGALEGLAETAWEPCLDTLELTLANLSLSRIELDECGAIMSELAAWRRAFDPRDREPLLRLKATVERGRRLAERFSDRILAWFPERAAKLGRALGVPEHAIRVFGDAEIRGHVVFQLSKLAALLLGRFRRQLVLSPWDVAVSGQAAGRVAEAARLGEMDPGRKEPTILLLQQAEGDEEIPACVSALILAHEIPHLSHLGVRARQAGVVLATCMEVSELAKVRSFTGQRLRLTAASDTVQWEAATEAAPAERPRRPVSIPEARSSMNRSWMELEETGPDTAGGKAEGARRLAELARQAGASFKTPPSFAIPFGVLEAALAAAPEVEAEYRQRLGCIDDLPPEQFKAGLERLRALIRGLEFPAEIGAEAGWRFGPEARLMVRSSANCEDLEALAGAGLYESVANVPISGFCAALRTVFSSLWSFRAALSRKQAGIPHERAHMAALVQQLVAPDYSFVLHTANPLNRNANEVYVELVPGLGETLVAAASRGVPYRLVCDKRSGAVTTLALASISQALWPAAAGGTVWQIVDYSQAWLSHDPEARRRLGNRLASIAARVEAAAQRPQDIEGVVAGEDIWLVQSRPQQGLRDSDAR